MKKKLFVFISLFASGVVHAADWPKPSVAEERAKRFLDYKYYHEQPLDIDLELELHDVIAQLPNNYQQLTKEEKATALGRAREAYFRELQSQQPRERLFNQWLKRLNEERRQEELRDAMAYENMAEPEGVGRAIRGEL